MIEIRQKGDFSKTRNFLKKAQKALKSGIFDKYGRMGVTALSSATPVDSGLTASSWTYDVEIRSGGNVSLIFSNTNVNKGVNIAIILQMGHGTGTGGYVQGTDYINPALKPIFEDLAKEVWREVVDI